MARLESHVLRAGGWGQPQLGNVHQKGWGWFPRKTGKLLPEEEGTHAGWAHKQNTLHAQRNNLFGVILDKNPFSSCLTIAMTHGVSSTFSQSRQRLDLPLLSLHAEPEEVISGHTIQKQLIEKKFGGMTEK